MSQAISSLTAPHRLQYTYKRSTGPVLGRFFGGLKEGRILGVRRKDGTVMVPPKEYDPDTGDALSELDEVATTGTVKSWAWVTQPREKQPIGKPFAYALIQLDGADVAMLHAVDAGGDERKMKTGMRVKARFAAAREGTIRDIEAFEPTGEAAKTVKTKVLAESELPALVELVKVPVQLDYTYSAGQAASRFLRGLAEGKLLGQRCPVDGKVYCPTRGACAEHGVPTAGEILEVKDRGTIVSYSIVRVPSENLQVELPFAAVTILLDGADSTFSHVVSEVKLEDVKMGMRVQAVWQPRETWTTSMKNIKYFKPSGEPDAPFDTYKDHL
ncbi:MAG TPA: OB-fold domain-containing protein [Myxococcota bacterium]|nr:OB-fold domain-containing protein [Myxococcota bacterium]